MSHLNIVNYHKRQIYHLLWRSGMKKSRRTPKIETVPSVTYFGGNKCPHPFAESEVNIFIHHHVLHVQLPPKPGRLNHSTACNRNTTINAICGNVTGPNSSFFCIKIWRFIWKSVFLANLSPFNKIARAMIDLRQYQQSKSKQQED